MTLALVGCGPDGSGGGDGGGEVVDLVIEPANPTVVVRNGVAMPVEFSARLVRVDDSTEPVEATWSIDRIQLGSLGGDDGRFVASGIAAGVGTVTATSSGISATTSVTVTIDDEYVLPGTPGDAPAWFPDAPPAGGPEAAVLLYPLDQAVMPSSIKPPHVQWEGGASGDLYRVVVTAGLARVTAYLSYDDGFDFAWAVAGSSWTALKNSAGDQPVTFEVDRRSATTTQTHRSSTHAVRVVSANVSGAIYYWDLSGGRILRITEDGRDDTIPSPPPNPENGSRCIACHTVSRDGRLLAVEMWGGNQPGAVFDLSTDLSADPAPAVIPPNRYVALYSTFNPDASRLMINHGTALSVITVPGGDPVTTTGAPLPQTGAAHPTWSPDGSLVAYIANHNGGWAVDFTVGDLAVIPVTGPDDFGSPVTLRPAEGLANSWPTFSPDSSWIAFGRGTHSRGRLEGVDQPGTMWLIERDGTNLVELSAANGGAQNSYLPNFSPFDEGGYFWLAFYSTRDYGNAQAGTKGTGRRQLWVTAISRNPQPGVDPSHVPFWLPDQDHLTDNMSAYWAPAPPVN